MDCSGLIKALFATLHVDLPELLANNFTPGKMSPLKTCKRGDLLFFSSDGVTPDHVGLYLGDNRFVHAEKKAGHVILTDLHHPWYAKHFLGARRDCGIRRRVNQIPIVYLR